MITVAARPEPTPARMRGSTPEDLAALGEWSGSTGCRQRRHGHARRRRRRRRGTGPPPTRSPMRGAGQQVDGAEGQERHVEDAAEQVEGPEAPGLPAEGGAGPQRRRSEGEHQQRDRPGELVAAPADQPALEGRAGEGQRDRVAAAAKALAVTAGHGSDGSPPCARVHVRRRVMPCGGTLRSASGASAARAPDAEGGSPKAVQCDGGRAGHGASPRRRWRGCRCTCAAWSSRPNDKTSTISSERLAELAGVNAAKVRKDLSYLGSYGTRGVGYDVEYLLFQMSRELGLTQDWPVVIVGVGNLGPGPRQLRRVRRPRLPGRGAGRRRPGQGRHRLGDLVVRSIDDLPEIAARAARRHRHHRHPGGRGPGRGRPARRGRRHQHPELRAGRSSPCRPRRSLRKVDLALELQILSFYQQQRAGGPPVAESRAS